MKRQYLTNTSGNIVIRSLREKTFQKIMSNDISYFDGNQSGEIVSRLSSGLCFKITTIKHNLAVKEIFQAQ